MADSTALEPGIGHNSKAVAEILCDDPNALFESPSMLDDLIQELQTEIEALDVNLETAKGRKEITTLCTRITKFKTSLDGEGKHKNEAAREAIAKVDSVRRDVRTRLDDLKAAARKPLTDWEKAEATRQNTITTTRQHIMTLGTKYSVMDTSAKIRSRIEELKMVAVDPEIFGDLTDDTEGLKRGTIAQLETVFERQKQHEDDQAELARMRAEREKEKAEREAKERAEAEAKAEQERKDRIEQEKKEAADKAAAEAAAEAKRKAEQEHAAKLDEERRQREAAERELAEKEAEEKRQAEDEAARKADEEHRSNVMREIEGGLIAQANISADTAQVIALAMVAGNVPHIEVKF